MSPRSSFGSLEVELIRLLRRARTSEGELVTSVTRSAGSLATDR